MGINLIKLYSIIIQIENHELQEIVISGDNKIDGKI